MIRCLTLLTSGSQDTFLDQLESTKKLAYNYICPGVHYAIAIFTLYIPWMVMWLLSTTFNRDSIMSFRDNA